MFMGDSSIFLGFFIGYISFETILNGYYSIIISFGLFINRLHNDFDKKQLKEIILGQECLLLSNTN